MFAKHIGAESNKGPFRSANEDSYWVSDITSPLEFGELYIVTDGVGGQEHGSAAAQLAARVIHENFYYLRGTGESVTAALNQAIHHANEAVYAEAQTRGGVKMGCTVVAVAQHKGVVNIAHVGDARVYLLHRNKLRQLTRDDSWVQKQLDAGIITPQEAENHELRNVVTQVLGNKLEIVVHQSQHNYVHKHDRLLLCSDGLHGVLNNAELRRLLQDGTPQTAVNSLIQAAIDAGTQDNITAVVVRLEQQKKVLFLPVWGVAGGILLLCLLAWAVFSALPSSNAGNGNDIPTQMTVTELPERIQATAVSPTPTLLPTPTTPPTPAPPTDIPPMTAPATKLPSPTASPAILRGKIVVGTAFLWTDDQIRTTDCAQLAASSLSSETVVRIIEAESVTINGPDSGCQPNQFIKVQSEDDSQIIGWVLEYAVQQLQPNDATAQP